MQHNFIILAAVCELSAARTEFPAMQKMMLKLAQSYRDLSAREQRPYRTLLEASASGHGAAAAT